MRRVILILIVAFGLGGFIAWWLTKAPETAPKPVPQNVQTAPPPTDTISITQGGTVYKIEPATNGEVMHEVVSTNWDDKLDEILADANIDEDVKADKIADMILKGDLPEAAQKDLAEHLVNLASDEEFAKSKSIVLNEKTPGSVSEVIMDDLFNRDDELKLPIYLEIAKNPNHPMTKEALENLEMLITEDYGTNWALWTEAVEKTLKGEEPPEAPEKP